jgi:hypothetical protein
MRGEGGHAGAAGAPESGRLTDRTDPARSGSIFYAERAVVIRAADISPSAARLHFSSISCIMML